MQCFVWTPAVPCISIEITRRGAGVLGHQRSYYAPATHLLALAGLVRIHFKKNRHAARGQAAFFCSNKRAVARSWCARTIPGSILQPPTRIFSLWLACSHPLSLLVRSLTSTSNIASLQFLTTLRCQIKVSNSILFRKFQNNPKHCAHPKT